MKDTQRSMRDTEWSRKDTQGSRRDTPQSRRDTEGSRKDTQGSRRDTQGSRRDTQGSRRDTEFSIKVGGIPLVYWGKRYELCRSRFYLRLSGKGRLKPSLQPDESRGSHLPSVELIRRKICQV